MNSKATSISICATISAPSRKKSGCYPTALRRPPCWTGSGYEVLASFGHIRDLPPKDASVDPENDFRMLWEVDAKSNQRLNDIARALKGADKLILATDPDREGEAISWH